MSKLSDLELTRACAEMMGITLVPWDKKYVHECNNGGYIYDESMKKFLSGPDGNHDWYGPLHDDAQAMALVKRFHLAIQPPQFVSPPRWHVWIDEKGVGKGKNTGIADVLNLNRAICECVAKLKERA